MFSEFTFFFTKKPYALRVSRAATARAESQRGLNDLLSSFILAIIGACVYHNLGALAEPTPEELCILYELFVICRGFELVYFKG